MNVLKALNEDRFNKVLINVNSINIINPCEIEIVANSIAHQVKNTNGLNQLPFQCVLTNNNAKLILSGIQNIVINVPQTNYVRTITSYVTAYNNFNTRICRIGFYKELTVEQLNNLMVLFNSEVNGFIKEYDCEFY